MPSSQPPCLEVHSLHQKRFRQAKVWPPNHANMYLYCNKLGYSDLSLSWVYGVRDKGFPYFDAELQQQFFTQLKHVICARLMP